MTPIYYSFSLYFLFLVVIEKHCTRKSNGSSDNVDVIEDVVTRE